MSQNLGRWMILVVVTTLLVGLLIAGQGLAQSGLTPQEQLGEFLYFDENLSEPAGQSCASCHDPGFGFVDPDKGLPVSEGVIPGVFGGRNSPSAAYAMYAPFFDDEVGGQFWDGRATGEVLDDPLADQALGPFLNSLEMNNPDELTVVRDALNGVYGGLFDAECGPIDLEDAESVLDAYDCIALSIAAFERTALFGQFSSKYDAYLQACLGLYSSLDEVAMDDCAKGIGTNAELAGMSTFTKKEWAGFQLFMDEENENDGTGGGAKCVACHVADWTAAEDYDLDVVVPDWAPTGMVPPLFTDFTYDNLGVPKSEHKLLRDNAQDLGLADGMFKVMTLRNIQLTKPYAHNGFFKNLGDITHFYNTRDVDAEGWSDPEVPCCVNLKELGNLGLSVEDEKALVEFMKTLTDK